MGFVPDRKPDPETPINERLYSTIQERERERHRAFADRQRRTLEIIGVLFGIGVAVLIVVGAVFLIVGS